MNQTLHTRRNFLKASFLGGAVAWTVPVFLERTFFAMDAVAADSMLQTATGRDHPILVLLQLAGGNDGLNTVIPFADDAYYRARPRLAIKATEVLPLSDGVGLHPSLVGLRNLYGDGLAAVISGVGYPNPNRSHFRSTDIWQTASGANQTLSDGWVGRYFDACCSGEDATTGIAIGREEPLAFRAKKPRAIAFDQPRNLQTEPGMMDDNPEAMATESEDSEKSGASVGMLSGANPALGNTSDFLRRVALDAHLGSEKIREVTGQFSPLVPFPATRLGTSLGLVSRLIAGSMPTRVYYVSQGGFDTHSNQAGSHERLLTELDGALTAFVAEMKVQGNLDRVLVMTFSEFGRRVAENASGGTDHGAAAPLFVLGGGVRPGLFGSPPRLDALDRGDLVHTTDFRSVYATVLEGWLGAPGPQILGRDFPRLDFLAKDRASSGSA